MIGCLEIRIMFQRVSTIKIQISLLFGTNLMKMWLFLAMIWLENCSLGAKKYSLTLKATPYFTFPKILELLSAGQLLVSLSEYLKYLVGKAIPQCVQ